MHTNIDHSNLSRFKVTLPSIPDTNSLRPEERRVVELIRSSQQAIENADPREAIAMLRLLEPSALSGVLNPAVLAKVCLFKLTLALKTNNLEIQSNSTLESLIQLKPLVEKDSESVLIEAFIFTNAFYAKVLAKQGQANLGNESFIVNQFNAAIQKAEKLSLPKSKLADYNYLAGCALGKEGDDLLSPRSLKFLQNVYELVDSCDLATQAPMLMRTCLLLGCHSLNELNFDNALSAARKGIAIDLFNSEDCYESMVALRGVEVTALVQLGRFSEACIAADLQASMVTPSEKPELWCRSASLALIGDAYDSRHKELRNSLEYCNTLFKKEGSLKPKLLAQLESFKETEPFQTDTLLADYIDFVIARLS